MCVKLFKIIIVEYNLVMWVRRERKSIVIFEFRDGVLFKIKLFVR